MKKYLMTGMAAIMFCGVFTSCSRESDFGGQTQQQKIQETYEEAFISRFGQPSPNLDWGFGDYSASKARTRGVVDNPTITLVGPTFNAKLTTMANNIGSAIFGTGTSADVFSDYQKYMPWWNSGWSDKFYQINGTVTDSKYSEDYLAQVRNIILKTIPEGYDNRFIAERTDYDYRVTTKENGPVTLTPIYHNSSSGDMISYYYYPASTTPTAAEIKALPKYTICNITDPQVCHDANKHEYFDHKTYSLVYDEDGPDGPIAPTYNFPKDIKICFIITNNDLVNGNLSIYESGGETVSDETPSQDPSDEVDIINETSGSLVPGAQAFKYEVKSDDSFFCGQYANGGPYGSFVRIGNGGQSDDKNERNDNYNDFGTAHADKAVEGFSAYIPGNGVDGDLSKNGTTVYYIKYLYNNSDGFNRNDDEFMMRLGIVINANKPLYIVELDDKNDTSGTPLTGYNGKTYTKKSKGIIEFRMKQGKTYAVYATGSKLGFYGCEVLYENTIPHSWARGETRGSTITPIVTTTLPNNPEFYGDANLNTEIHQLRVNDYQWLADTWIEGVENNTSHIAVFSIGDKNFIGFEDWLDFDYNDVIFEVTNTSGGTEIEEELDEWEEIRVIAEDLSVGQNTDFDFNDIVYDVRRYTKDTQNKHKNGDIEVILRAAGGTLPLFIGTPLKENIADITEDDYKNYEVHRLFNVDQYTMVNTHADSLGYKGKDNAAPVALSITPSLLASLGVNTATATIGQIARAIPVWVIKNETAVLLDAPDASKGIASKIGVKIQNDGYVWCNEREDIDARYHLTDGTSLFQDWVQGNYIGNDWWIYAKKSLQEYKDAKAAQAAANSTNP